MAEYSTPEKFFGEAFTNAVYQRQPEDQRQPEESFQRILEHLHTILPDVPDKSLRSFLK